MCAKKKAGKSVLGKNVISNTNLIVDKARKKIEGAKEVLMQVKNKSVIVGGKNNLVIQGDSSFDEKTQEFSYEVEMEEPLYDESDLVGNPIVEEYHLKWWQKLINLFYKLY